MPPSGEIRVALRATRATPVRGKETLIGLNGPNRPTIEHWFHSLNRGYPIRIVGTADAHGQDGGEPGYSRTYVQYREPKGAGLGDDRFGIRVSIAQARRPMGLAKRDHLQALFELPEVTRQWRELRHRPETAFPEAPGQRYNRPVTTPPLSPAGPPPEPEACLAALSAATEVWTASLGPRLISIVLFGSLARGEATAGSDIDVLVVARDFPRRLGARRAELLALFDRARDVRPLPAVEWNIVAKTPEEAREHSPLYLDMVEDGRILFDRDGFFAGVLDRMRARMRELGSRRVLLPDGSWYWDLKPDFTFGDEVSI